MYRSDGMWFVVVATAVWAIVPLGLVVYLALRYRPGGRQIGGGPFTAPVGLDPGESARATLFAIYKTDSLIGYHGLLAITDRRLIVAPRLWALAPGVTADGISVPLDSIIRWRVERKRGLGIGAVVPLPRDALIIEALERPVYTIWGAPGFDVKMVLRHLPHRDRNASAESGG